MLSEWCKKIVSTFRSGNVVVRVRFEVIVKYNCNNCMYLCLNYLKSKRKKNRTPDYRAQPTWVKESSRRRARVVDFIVLLWSAERGLCVIFPRKSVRDTQFETLWIIYSYSNQVEFIYYWILWTQMTSAFFFLKFFAKNDSCLGIKYYTKRDSVILYTIHESVYRQSRNDIKSNDSYTYSA